MGSLSKNGCTLCADRSAEVGNTLDTLRIEGGGQGEFPV